VITTLRLAKKPLKDAGLAVGKKRSSDRHSQIIA
jgi:hypothetical protein